MQGIVLYMALNQDGFAAPDFGGEQLARGQRKVILRKVIAFDNSFYG